MGGNIGICCGRSSENGQFVDGVVLNVELLRRFPEVEWEGWGCSLSWLGKALGNSNDAEAWADLLFTTKDDVGIGRIWAEDHYVSGRDAIPGLGLTIARYNVGGCGGDGSGECSPAKTCDWHIAIEGYQPMANGAFDMSRDAAQRRFLQLSVERGVKHVELYSNAPMWWMSSSRSSFGGSLRCPDEFSMYLAEVASHMRDKLGFPVKSLAPFNEPSESWTFPALRECCHVTVKEQAQFLNKLRSDFDKRQLHEVIIAGSDERSPAAALATWQKIRLGQAGRCVGRVNVHTSEDDEDPRRVSPMLGMRERVALSNVVREDNLGLWMSGHNDHATDGISLAQQIIVDLNCLAPCAWCYWQIVEHCNPCGLVEAHFAPHGSHPTKMAQPKFYIFAHFTRVLRPGFKLLRLTSGEMCAVGAYSSDASVLVLVLLNVSNSRCRMNLKIPSYAKVPADGGWEEAHWANAVFSQPDKREFLKARPVQTSNAECGELYLHLDMLPRSVCSVVVDNVKPLPAPASKVGITASAVEKLAEIAAQAAACDRFHGADDARTASAWWSLEHEFSRAAEALQLKWGKQQSQWLPRLKHLRELLCNAAWAAAIQCRLGENASEVRQKWEFFHNYQRQKGFGEAIGWVICYTCQAVANEVYRGMDSKPVNAARELAKHHMDRCGSNYVVIPRL